MADGFGAKRLTKRQVIWVTKSEYSMSERDIEWGLQNCSDSCYQANCYEVPTFLIIENLHI